MNVANLSVTKGASTVSVALIRPPMAFSRSSYASPINPPLGLAYLSAALKERGHHVVCIDAVGEDPTCLRVQPELNCFVRGLSATEIVERLPADLEAVGVSCMFSQEWLVTRDLINRVRLARPDVFVFVGGEHVTAVPEHVLDTCTAVDAVALGEGDEVIVDLVERFRTYPETIPGIVYRVGEDLYRTVHRQRVRNLADLPFPEWESIPIEKYHDYESCSGVYEGVTMPILATRGCPYKCTFCSNPRMWGVRYYMRPPGQVIDEIEDYVRRYSASSIEFYDLTAVLRKKWIHEFCDLYLERGLKASWSLPTGTRSEALDETTLRKLKATNCNYLTYAPESGSEDTLLAINKRVKLPTAISSMRSAKRLGLVLKCHLLIGIPGETRRDIFQTVALQWRLALYGVDDLPIFQFSPYPGSELFDSLLESGEIANLDDKYFVGLVQESGNLRSVSYNKDVCGWEYTIYRTLGMSVAYLLGYIRYPKRILRTIRAVLFTKRSHTLFEQRMIEVLRNREKFRDEPEEVYTLLGNDVSRALSQGSGEYSNQTSMSVVAGTGREEVPVAVSTRTF